MTFTCSETVDVTPASKVDLSLIFISDLTGDHTVSMFGATINSVSDDPTVTLTLTEAQRVAAIAISGVPGGDNDAVVLDVEPGSLTDITGTFFSLYWVHTLQFGVCVGCVFDMFLCVFLVCVSCVCFLCIFMCSRYCCCVF
jgi:hypothetical protein